jgi:hypothetical protein
MVNFRVSESIMISTVLAPVICDSIVEEVYMIYIGSCRVTVLPRIIPTISNNIMMYIQNRYVIINE